MSKVRNYELSYSVWLKMLIDVENCIELCERCKRNTESPKILKKNNLFCYNTMHVYLVLVHIALFFKNIFCPRCNKCNISFLWFKIGFNLNF